VVKELDQARLAIRKGFDRLLEAVSKHGRPKPATAKRTKKRVAKKVTGRKSARKKPGRPRRVRK